MGQSRPTGLRGSVADVVTIALAAGLGTGVGEAAFIGWRYVRVNAVTHATPHVVWMAPLAYGTLAVVLIALALPFSRRGSRRIGAAVFLSAWPGLAGWIAMLPWSLYGVAVGLISAGASLQIARLAMRHPARTIRVARVAATGLALIVLAGAACVVGIERYRERASLSAVPEADPGVPNVLLLVLDTVRAKSLGFMGGSPVTSPNIDSLAAHAIVFENAVATAPWTLPSHASMFTGRWPHELSVGWSSALDGEVPTVAEELARRGYATAGFVANLSYAARPYGLDRGFAHYEDFPISVGQAVLSTSLGREVSTIDALRSMLHYHELLNRKDVDRINRDFLAWLDGRPDRPFFAFLNYFDAHEPYEPPADLRRLAAPGYRRSNMGHRHNLLRGVNARRLEKAGMPAADIPRELALYEASVRDLDRGIGELLRSLEERGLLENTVLILVSDHGEQFGEHGLFEHGQSLYEPVIHVPLVIRLPGDPPVDRLSDAVSIRDIAATILDLAAGAPDVLPGSSLAPLWGPSRPGDPAVVISPAVSELARGLVEQPWYPIARGLEMQSMTSGTIQYICNPDASEELYDLATDPDESSNLVGTPVGDQAVLAFRSAIAHVGAPPRWCPPPPGDAPRPPEPTG